ncbi:uncharacterized protein K441DRAFT_660139 [Cenococcum geophilum 1.58]|uniref:uncharacterized protein n=1 Tax=Cenococcum geophilum 1.58 TaxID=794803 RepID=UPI00358F4D34|nr:hypothetical protein K441DRAFT_660139 [Cenococcum geophilum 1.58]
MLQAGGSQAYTHTLGHSNGSKGRISSISRYSQVKWKHGTSGRQGKIGNQDTPLQESPSSDLAVFFLPLT